MGKAKTLLILLALVFLASSASAWNKIVDVQAGGEVLLPTGTGVTDGIVKVTIEKLTGESVWSWITDWFSGGTKKVEGRVYIKKGEDFYDLDCTSKTMRYFILDPNEEVNCNLDRSMLQQYFYGETYADNPEPVKVKVISNDTEKARLQITIDDAFLKKAANKINPNSASGNSWLELDFTKSINANVTFDQINQNIKFYSDAQYATQLTLDKKVLGNKIYLNLNSIVTYPASLFFKIDLGTKIGAGSLTKIEKSDLMNLPAGAQ